MDASLDVHLVAALNPYTFMSVVVPNCSYVGHYNLLMIADKYTGTVRRAVLGYGIESASGSFVVSLRC